VRLVLNAAIGTVASRWNLLGRRLFRVEIKEVIVAAHKILILFISVIVDWYD
jgi:hypothetical protein